MSVDRKVVVLIALLASAGGAARLEPAARDLGREVLAPNDGWASLGAGTTGGAAAAHAEVYVVAEPPRADRRAQQRRLSSAVDTPSVHAQDHLRRRARSTPTWTTTTSP